MAASYQQYPCLVLASKVRELRMARQARLSQARLQPMLLCKTRRRLLPLRLLLPWPSSLLRRVRRVLRPMTGWTT